MVMYMVEVKNVKNSDTNKITYFQLVCGAWQRISKAKYRRLTSHADRADSFSTEIKGNKVHQYGAYYYNNLADIEV